MTITLAGRRYRIRDSLSFATLPDYRTAPAAFLAAVIDADKLPTLSVYAEADAAEVAWHELITPERHRMR
jgi:hypothetical protein